MRNQFVLIAILFIAFAFRVIGITSVSPPGLEHDEVANWLIDRAILNGQHAVYFTEAYGHEAGFHYFQAASVALLGDHALALRLPAAFAGLLLVAVCYALTRRLFGQQVALIAMALLAVLFWPVFYSRLGLRAIALPLVAGLSAYCWWVAWSKREQGANWNGRYWFVLAGIMAGLSAYTYMAARALPIFYALFILYLAFFHWVDFKTQWRAIIWFAMAYALVSMPLLQFLQNNAGAEFRITEVDAPLQSLLNGDFIPVLINGIKIAGMFGDTGDMLWRQNVAGRPVFDPLLAVLFFGGVALSMWRIRDARYAFLLLWLGTATIPSLVTVDAPSSIRMINALLIVTVFPALVMHSITTLSTDSPQLSTRIAYFLAGIFVLYHIWWTAVAVFNSWPNNDEVQFVWQKALTETAVALDNAPENSPVAVGGWSPDTLDPPTMALSMRRDDLDLRYFGSDSTAVPLTTLIIPATQGDSVRITHPQIRELVPQLQKRLNKWGTAQSFNSFVLYELAVPLFIEPQVETEIDFGDQIRLLGYDQLAVDQLITYWQVLEPPTASRRFFVHLVDAAGNILAQHDGLDAPATYWQRGDLLVQMHQLSGQIPVNAELRLGIYDPQTGQRLSLPDGADYFVLP